MLKYEHVYLSPHYDDVSLSCGGAIHNQVQAGQPVLVVTVCAAPPPANDPLSPFAAGMHKRWGNPEDVVAARQIEDQASMEVLGADYLLLEFVDCIYRGKPFEGKWYYNNDTELFGQIHASDLSLTDNIVATLVETVPYEDGMVLYSPLTVGNHIDHQLVYHAARKLQHHGWTVVFYEDYPYIDPKFVVQGNPINLESTLARLNEIRLRPEIRFFSEVNLQAKIDSIAAYASQIEPLFGDGAQMTQQVREYFLQIGAGKPAERIWVPV